MMHPNLIEVKESKSPAYRMIQSAEVDSSYVSFLENKAFKHILKRARILLHDENESVNHSMIIVKVCGCIELIKPLPAISKKIHIIRGSFASRRDENEIIYNESDTVEFDPQYEYEFEVLSDVLIIREDIVYF